MVTGRLLGPFVTPPHSQFIRSLLGVIPKKEQASFRVIHDLSFPKGKAVNDMIPNHLTAVSYEDFDHVAALIVAQGRGCLIAKVDIKSAFRILPIHPNSVHLFGFSFKEEFYMDKCLPMGCSLSCVLFECFSSSLQDVLLRSFSFHCVSHILDDFIFIAPAGSGLCQKQLECFTAMAQYADIPIKSSKTVLPTCVAPIHGIEVDTRHFTSCLPRDKIDTLTQLLISFKDKRSARLKAWQSLIGSLSFTTWVVQPG